MTNRASEEVRLFKMVDGSLMYSETPTIRDEGVEFDMTESWILVTKTDDKGRSELQIFSMQDMMFKPSIMYFPWTSIIVATDINEASGELIRNAFTEHENSLHPKDNKTVEGKF